MRSRDRKPNVGATVAEAMNRFPLALLGTLWLSYEPMRIRSYLARARRPLLGAAAVGLCVMIGTPAAARPSLLSAINAVRTQGCEGQRGVKTPLRSNRKLDSAAKRIARGERLRSVLPSVGYRALHSASMSVKDSGDIQDAADRVARIACEELSNAAVHDIGVARSGGNLWIVLAQPFEAPDLENARDVTTRVLALANEARARARRCGSKSFEAAPPLRLADALSDAARVQARDMAKNNMLAHEGSDGSTPADRVTRERYKWRMVGENVASGPTTAEEVMAGWLASPGHCENVMSPRFTEMGIAYVVDAKSESGVYWSQVFATPR